MTYMELFLWLKNGKKKVGDGNMGGQEKIFLKLMHKFYNRYLHFVGVI